MSQILSDLFCQLSEGRLQLGEHAVEGHQQHLTRGHLWRFLCKSVHAARLDQLGVLSAQHPEDRNVCYGPRLRTFVCRVMVCFLKKNKLKSKF